MELATSTIDAVITGAFGVIGIFLSLRWGKTQKRRADEAVQDNKDQAERDLFTYQVTRPLVEMPAWGVICSKNDNHVNDDQKKVIRILLFVCVNGKDDPKTTTAVWQWRDDQSGYQAYIEVDLTKRYDDGDYVGRLRKTRQNGRFDFGFEDLPPCIIGDVGKQEKLGETCWYWIGNVPSEATQQIAGVYLSAATGAGDELPEDEMLEIQNIVWEMFEPIAAAYAQYGYKMVH